MPHTDLSPVIVVLLVVGVGYILKLLFDDGEPSKKKSNFWNKDGSVNKHYTRWPR